MLRGSSSTGAASSARSAAPPSGWHPTPMTSHKVRGTHTHTHIEKPMPMNSLFFLPGRMNDSKECGSTVISSNGQCVKVLESVFAFSYRLEPMLWVIVTALPDVCRRTGRYVCGSVCHMIVFWAGLRWWGLSHDGLLGQLSASQVWC